MSLFPISAQIISKFLTKSRINYCQVATALRPKKSKSTRKEVNQLYKYINVYITIK